MRRAQVGADFVGQHFLEAESEQMPGIPAIGTGNNVASRASRAAWVTVTQRTTIGQACADCDVAIDVAHAILLVDTLPLQAGELTLEQLAPPPNGAERIAVDDVHRRSRRIHAFFIESSLTAERKWIDWQNSASSSPQKIAIQ